MTSQSAAGMADDHRLTFPGAWEPGTDPEPVASTAVIPGVAAHEALLGRIAVGVLLAATGVLYLWDLGASSWANAYYSAAALAGSQNWLAFLFGSFDAGNAITVDKTPASLWVMSLSVRLFGLSSWSVLVPQALMGIATVGLLYATVARVAGRLAGLVAGAGREPGARRPSRPMPPRTWTAATTGSNNAAGLALSSETSVMAIGGFNGSDPAPTLEQFQSYVADGRIHYYAATQDAGGFRGTQGGSAAAAEIAAWVAATYTPATIGGVTVYDLTLG